MTYACATFLELPEVARGRRYVLPINVNRKLQPKHCIRLRFALCFALQRVSST